MPPELKTAEELSALRQEVKDFKEEIFPKLREIKDKVCKTNGTVAKVMRQQAVTKERQDSCPARKYHQNPSKIDVKSGDIQDQIRNIKIWGAAIASLVLIIQIINLFQKFL